MKLLLLTLLTHCVISAPLLYDIIGPGGLAEVDLSGWSVISPSSDTTKVNINKGYGNYVGPQYAPASVYGGYGTPAAGGLASPQFSGPQQWFNSNFPQGIPQPFSAQGFPQARGNQLKPQRT